MDVANNLKEFFFRVEDLKKKPITCKVTFTPIQNTSTARVGVPMPDSSTNLRYLLQR